MERANKGHSGGSLNKEDNGGESKWPLESRCLNEMLPENNFWSTRGLKSSSLDATLKMETVDGYIGSKNFFELVTVTWLVRSADDRDLCRCFCH